MVMVEDIFIFLLVVIVLYKDSVDVLLYLVLLFNKDFPLLSVMVRYVCRIIDYNSKLEPQITITSFKMKTNLVD